MQQAIKKNGNQVNAYQLGVGHPMEQQLIEEGAIIDHGDGTYELFSQEAINGAGQVAKVGDYFKVDEKDGRHFPYPNEKAWFEENHELVSGDIYMQKPKPIEFYQWGEELSPKMQQLINSGALRIDKSNPDKTFSAHLWDADLSLPKDGRVVIYGEKEDGSIDFNLVQKKDFDKNYISFKDAYSLAFQNLLFHEPLFQFIEEKEQNMNVLVIGWNLAAEMFVDQCLQAGQMQTYQVSITVVSEDAFSSAAEYQAARPAMSEFININGSLDDRKDESFGELRFVSYPDMEERIFEGEGQIEDFLMDVLANLEEGKKQTDQKDHYFLVSVGDDVANREIAESLNTIATTWGLSGEHTVHYVLTLADVEKKGEVTPVCAFGVEGVEEIDSKLEQIAFNVHLGWKDNIDGDNQAEYKNFKEDTYNYRSSVAMALSLKYKLQDIGISMDDLDKAAEEVERVLVSDDQTDKLHQLAVLEHRRWILFMASDGWQAPDPEKKEMDRFYKESVDRQNLKDFDKKLHLCMVRSTASSSPTAKGSVVDKALWDNVSPSEGLEGLDELDRVSVRTHRKMYAKATDYLRQDPLRSGTVQDVQNKLEPIEDDNEVKQEWHQFLFCLENILVRNLGYSLKYSKYKKSFLDAAIEDEEIDIDFLEEKLELLDKEIWPVIQSNQYVDYKKNDEENIWKIPFFLTYRKDLELALSFFYGGQGFSVGDIMFQHVASAKVIRPAKIRYVVDLSQESDMSVFYTRVKAVRSYFTYLNMGCELHFIAVGPSEMPGDQKDAWQKCFEKLKRQGVIESKDVAFAARGQSPLSLLNERLNQSSVDCYDCSVPVCASTIDNAMFLDRIKQQLPYFEFDRRKKRFFNNEQSCFLSYIDDHSYLNISEMFVLSGADHSEFNYPGLANDYKILWNIYKGFFDESVNYDSMTERDINYARSAWKSLCSALKKIMASSEEPEMFMIDELDSQLDETLKGDTFQIKNKKKNEIAVLICKLADNAICAAPWHALSEEEMMSLRDWIPPEIPRTHRREQYLIPESKDGTLMGFQFANEEIKKLLTKEGAMLETYVYYSVCESGLFDDVASSYEFHWLKPEVDNELDLVLTKGFQSVIVECKDQYLLSQDFYFKLGSLVHLFGVNCKGVLVTNCDMDNEPEKNQKQIDRGDMMGIVTINGLDNIEHIGENLNALID